MMKKTLLSFIAMLLSLQLAFAQRAISGVVKGGDTNDYLIGASVTLKGTTKGTTTDVNGKFLLDVPKEVSTITVSFIGYQPKDVVLSDLQNNLQIVLTAGEELSELVVVGYTTQKKTDLTGSVAVVDLKPVKNNSSGNPMQSLQGRVSGLYIEKDGSPNGSNGRILIRGANTLGNNDPLYIIDGIPTTRPEVFQNILKPYFT